MAMTLDANSWSAIGSVVNAVVVVVLAVINYLYLRAANRQAKAAEEQAKAALESLRLALRPHQLDVERDLARIKDAFAVISSELDAIITNAKSKSRWDGPIVSADWAEIKRLFMSLFPESYDEFSRFLERLDVAIKSRERAQIRNPKGEFFSNDDIEILLTDALDAQERLKSLKRKMKAASPQSSAFLN